LTVITLPGFLGVKKAHKEIEPTQANEHTQTNEHTQAHAKIKQVSSSTYNNNRWWW
jgi:hypothetical protein